MGDPMAFLVSGVTVVNGYTQTMRAAMEPDDPTQQNPQKRAKLDIKRQKNRESSARSRQRKKDEDERNEQEVSRLTDENERLNRKIANLEREGQALLCKVHPYYYDNPKCKGCASTGDESSPSIPLLPQSSLPNASNEQLHKS